jgi:hypothetical protein
VPEKKSSEQRISDEIAAVRALLEAALKHVERLARLLKKDRGGA